MIEKLDWSMSNPLDIYEVGKKLNEVIDSVNFLENKEYERINEQVDISGESKFIDTPYRRSLRKEFEPKESEELSNNEITLILIDQAVKEDRKRIKEIVLVSEMCRCKHDQICVSLETILNIVRDTKDK